MRNCILKKLARNCHIDLAQKALLDNKQIKLIVMQHYSNNHIPECKICKQKDIRYLTIDHINAGGYEHRKKNKISGCGTTFYRWLIKNGFPNGFQVLCIACNWEKGRWTPTN